MDLHWHYFVGKKKEKKKDVSIMFTAPHVMNIGKVHPNQTKNVNPYTACKGVAGPASAAPASDVIYLLMDWQKRSGKLTQPRLLNTKAKGRSTLPIAALPASNLRFEESPCH